MSLNRPDVKRVPDFGKQMRAYAGKSRLHLLTRAEATFTTTAHKERKIAELRLRFHDAFVYHGTHSFDEANLSRYKEAISLDERMRILQGQKILPARRFSRD